MVTNSEYRAKSGSAVKTRQEFRAKTWNTRIHPSFGTAQFVTISFWGRRFRGLARQLR
jgi:hypothetical protein